MSQILQAYLHCLIQNSRFVDARGIQQMQRLIQLTLDDIYVGLTMRLDKQGANLYQPAMAHLDELAGQENAAHHAGVWLNEATAKTEPQINIDQLWERGSIWVLLGDPGAGKTTVLKHLALSTAQNLLNSQLDNLPSYLAGFLPIPITLRLFAHSWEQHSDWTTENALLEYFLSDGLKELQWQHYYPFEFDANTAQSELRELILTALQEMRVLWLLDGLDEHSHRHRRHRTNEAIEAILQSYPANRCLVSSRSLGYHDAPLHSGFLLATLEPFNQAQRREFFYLWSLAIAKADHPTVQTEALQQLAADKMDSVLEQIEQAPGVIELATNPLFCTIIGLIHQQQGALPTQRVQLYKVCVDTLTYSWESHKRRHFDPHVTLSFEEMQEVLEVIALHFQEHCPENRSSAHSLLQVTEHYLKTEVGMDNQEAEEKAQQWVRLIREVSGLLNERGNEVYGFFHLSLQEYLTARAILRNKLKFKHYVDYYLLDSRWREVFRLAAAHQGSISPELGSEVIEQYVQHRHPRDVKLHYSFRFAFMCLRETRVKLDTANQLLKRWIEVFIRFPALSPSLVALLSRIGLPLRYQHNTLRLLFTAAPRLTTDMRHYAVQALAYLPSPTTLTLLCEYLRDDPDEPIRISAAMALGMLNDSQAVSELQHSILHDAESAVRQAAADALGKIRHKSVVSVLLELHRHWLEQLGTGSVHDTLTYDFKTHRLVLEAIGKHASADGLNLLLHVLQPLYPVELRCAAVNGLAQQLKSPQALDTLVQILQFEENDQIRQTAAQTLGKAHNAAVLKNLLQQLNQHPDHLVRRRLCEAFHYYHLFFTQSLHLIQTALLQALQYDADAGVRWRAAQALARFKGTTVVDALSHALCHDNNAWVRWRAAEALRHLQDSRAVPALIQALTKDTDEVVQWRAAEALGHLQNPAAIKVLLQVLQSPQVADSLLWRVMQSLGRLQEPRAALPLAKTALQHPDAEVRIQALKILAQLNQPIVLDTLTQIIQQESNEYVRQAAAEALGMLRTPKAISPLIHCLKNEKNEWVRWQAVASLGFFNEVPAIHALTNAIYHDTDEWVQWRAAEALGKIRHPEAIKILLHALRNHSDEWIRWRIVQALGNTRQLAAVNHLYQTLLQDNALVVRRAAAVALEKIELGEIL